MNIKLDENLPSELAPALRLLGHDVHTMSDEGLRGVDDASLMAHVQREVRALITLDKGIANVRVYPPGQYAGIVLFRPDSLGRSAVLNFAVQHLPKLLQ